MAINQQTKGQFSTANKPPPEYAVLKKCNEMKNAEDRDGRKGEEVGARSRRKDEMGRPRGLPSYSIRQLKVGPATIARVNRDETIDQPTKGRVLSQLYSLSLQLYSSTS
jgi:hypothetical protein